MHRRLFLAAPLTFFARGLPAHAQGTKTEWQEARPFVDGIDSIVDLPGGEAPKSLPEALAAYDSDQQRVRNFGAPADGLGLCVFATLDMMARFQNIPELVGIIHQVPNGGGYPAKVKEIVARHAPHVEVSQYGGTDPSFLELAMRCGIPVGVTYGYGQFYGNKRIPHMVMLTHLDAKWAKIIDNNDPLNYTRMRRDEFLKRWSFYSGQGWAYVLIAPGPPPAPYN